MKRKSVLGCYPTRGGWASELKANLRRWKNTKTQRYNLRQCRPCKQVSFSQRWRTQMAIVETRLLAQISTFYFLVHTYLPFKTWFSHSWSFDSLLENPEDWKYIHCPSINNIDCFAGRFDFPVLSSIEIKILNIYQDAKLNLLIFFFFPHCDETIITEKQAYVHV